jgi:hypothetical protein
MDRCRDRLFDHRAESRRKLRIAAAQRERFREHPAHFSRAPGLVMEV